MVMEKPGSASVLTLKVGIGPESVLTWNAGSGSVYVLRSIRIWNTGIRCI